MVAAQTAQDKLNKSKNKRAGGEGDFPERELLNESNIFGNDRTLTEQTETMCRTNVGKPKKTKGEIRGI